MVTLMRFALRFACGTQYTDRQTNRQTNRDITRPHVNPHLGRRVRAYKILDMWAGNRERYALRSEAAKARAIAAVRTTKESTP